MIWPRRGRPTLRTLYAATTLAAGLILTAAVAGLALTEGALAAVPVGIGLAVVAAGLTMRSGVALGRALDALRSGDPGAASVAGFELMELARTINALQMRARVSDELAEAHRRSAETASAGMFELLSGLVAAEEATRGQLSAELHDTVAQSLMLSRSLLADGSPEAVAKAAEHVTEAEDQVRAVMARTRPPALRDGDLARAVTVLRDDLEVRYGLQVELSWPAEPHPLPLVTAVTIYRFFQETLLNVVKHADVDAATATLEVDEETVTATVRDEGEGFTPDLVKSERGRHVGLGLLRERARLAGGVVEIDSAAGQGTTVTLRLPRTGLPVRPIVPSVRVSRERVAAPSASGGVA